MSATVHTGWRWVTPGCCSECGEDDQWQVDGRGNVLCACSACPDCGLVDAYGMHEPACPQVVSDAPPWFVGDTPEPTPEHADADEARQLRRLDR